MNEKIQKILAQITELEDELEDILQARQEHILYRLKDGKIRFKQEIEEAHKELKENLLRWFLSSRPRNIISAPFIYSMIIPFVLFDICISVYQIICFPLYQIKMVKRSRYIVIDRYHLRHLNSFERFHCIYCGYANGLLAYVREIAARTEQYWCPIKHARRIIDRHPRYQYFIDFGDAEYYQKHLQELRQKLAKE